MFRDGRMEVFDRQPFREYRIEVRIVVVDTAQAFWGIGLPAITDCQSKVSAWMSLPFRISESISEGLML